VIGVTTDDADYIRADCVNTVSLLRVENAHMPTVNEIRSLDVAELRKFVAEDIASLVEDEALAILDNRYVTPAICQSIAQNPRLTGFYSVRCRLVEHRQTPQGHAVKLVHYLYWTDLVRISVDMKVPTTVRRAIDTLLLARVEKLSLGERVASAKRCSQALIKVFLFDPEPRVFSALLVNQRLREEDLVLLAGSDRVSIEQLRLLAADTKWSFRYAIRKALVLNPLSPRSVAASQLRFLIARDLREIYSNPKTSTYLRRCIERLQAPKSSSTAASPE
jgi:hypothetical protein